MLHMSRAERLYSAGFIIALLLAFLVNILSQLSLFPRNICAPASILYCFILLAWSVTVEQRIVHSALRRYLVAIAALLLMLFLIRICRWILFANSPLAVRYLWYAFYIPFLAMPLLSLSAAFCVGRGEGDGLPALLKAGWAAAGLLMLGVLTNDLHHAVFSFRESSDSGDSPVNYHWLYYGIFSWSFALTLCAFFVLIKRCRLSQCREKWYIPIIPSAAAFALMAVYYVLGGSSPVVSGISLYNIQEVYLALYLGLWEGCIKIGLIPANTGYSRLFERTHINAVLKSADGERTYRSGAYADTGDSADCLIKTCPIRGGSVTWREDVSAVNRLNRDIRDITQQLERENALIEKENRITAEKSRVETQNRLYDRIARHTRPQLVRIEKILQDDGAAERKMQRCMLLGTYVKRCSNLMLVAEQRRELSTDELFLSIRESMEQMGFLGIVCELIRGEPRKLPPGRIITAYDVFESVIESVLDTALTLSVRVSPSEAVLLSIETDAPVRADSIRRSRMHGLTVTAFVEDEIQHITLSAGGAGNG